MSLEYTPGVRPIRHATNTLLEMIEVGLLSADDVVMMCVKAMSEDDVKHMMVANEIDETFFEDHAYDED